MIVFLLNTALIARFQKLIAKSPLPTQSTQKSIDDSPIRFTYQSIDFKLDSCETPERHAPETMAGGVAVFDYNNDGKLDIFFANGADIKALQKTSPKYYNRLFENDGKGHFTDVTEKAGLKGTGYDIGVAIGDYDNDGYEDIFVTGVYRNTLYHNNGDGTFTDVNKESGIGQSLGKAWGAMAADVNNDGNMDLFVSNDTVTNFLFLNRGDGRFREAGLEAGVAYSADGRPRSGMGVDAADYDQDGWMDLCLTNVDHEMYSLYHNSHDETFTDEAVANGIASNTVLMSGWGLKFFDFDNDGNTDLFVANGHPDDTIEKRFTNIHYREKLLLFRNVGGSFQHSLENVSAQGGPVFEESFSARGLAVGDFDNDGAIDVLISNNNDAPLLLRNVAA